MKKSFFMATIFLIFILFSACGEISNIPDEDIIPPADMQITESSPTLQAAENPAASQHTAIPVKEKEAVNNDFSWQGDIELEGVIGDDMKVHMNLSIDKTKITGQYRYDEVGENIELNGNIGNNLITLHEVDYKSTVYGIIEPDNTIRGIWKEQGYWEENINKYPIYLYLSGEAVPNFKKPVGDITKLAGQWTGINSNYFASSSLFVEPLFDDLFYFHIIAADGGNLGDSDGFATFQNDIATFIANDGYEPKIVTFKFSLNKDGNIFLDANDYTYNCGMGVRYDSVFTKKPVNTSLPDKIGGDMLTDEQNEIMKDIAGESYETFVAYAQYCYKIDSIDDFDADVFCMYVRGLAPFCNGIIMINKEDGTIMAAIRDYPGAKYFTNSPNFTKPPKTIQAWIDKGGSL